MVVLVSRIELITFGQLCTRESPVEKLSRAENREWIDKGWDRKRIGNG